MRRELYLSIAVLFGGAVLFAGLGLILLLPLLQSPGEATLFILLLVLGDLFVLFLFIRALLGRTLLRPLDRLVGDARRMAEGDYRHRIAPAETHELLAVSQSVNAMADRLIRDQHLLAENIRSLEETNRELVIARDQVVRAARLASVGTLAAGLAHEVGNPLGAMMGYLDVARRRAEGGDDVSELLDATVSEAKRIDRIIRGVLDYARPRGELSGTAEPIPVAVRVRDFLGSQGRLEGVEVSWEFGEVNTLVHGDSHHLEQVLVNLLLNAEHALEGRPDPRIAVSVSEEEGEGRTMPVRREGDPPGVNYAHRRRLTRAGGVGTSDALKTAETVVVIRVLDNGPGIPIHALNRVFDPFFTTKDPGQGTGLGLAVCARLVEEMGGVISADNRAEGGAVFEIRIPGVPAPAPARRRELVGG